MRRYFITGLVVLIPILCVILFVAWMVDLSDRALALLPEAYRPETWLGFRIPGLGIILGMVLAVVVGALATNFLGRHLLAWFDRFLAKVPVIRSLYAAVKQLMEAVLGKGGRAFQEVVLVSFPQEGQWTIGFVTGTAHLPQLKEEELISVFVPTTPNPTSGWLLFLPREKVRSLPISVEEGLKLVVSGGMIAPKEGQER